MIWAVQRRHDVEPDTTDGCPLDANKIDAGVCGCGVPDIDSDGDGTPDCADACPNDSDKTEPGQCGCGQPETDVDGDGRICPDNCPDTANADQADADGDGAGDVCDLCPNDPVKTDDFGACGLCGADERDFDADGVPNCNDNCWYSVNPDQSDGRAAAVITCDCGIG